ncbi:MAG TPA: cyclic pyranopterin monophosphate synthase MoaC [Desulfomonilia bacterium]
MPLSHINKEGDINMVDVGNKVPTKRIAAARGKISMSREAFEAITSGTVSKGNVLATAKIAGIMAAKNTSSTIPLCHPLQIEKVSIDFYPDEKTCSFEAEAIVSVSGKTGVEMEAIHSVSIALITIYDMAKAVDKSMTISDIRLMEKSGGKSGNYKRR